MKALVFDMDGTLIKEERYWKVASEVAFDLVRSRIPFSFIQNCKNNGINSNWKICYEFVKGKVKVSYEEVRNLFQKKLAELNPLNELIIGEDSLLEIFTNFKGRYKFFIATTRPRKEALEAVNSTILSIYFNESTVFAREDVQNKEPLKNNLLSLVKEKANLEDYTIVGDTISDIEAGKSLGFKTIGVYESLNNEEELDQARADFVIASIASLSIILEGT